MSVAELMTMEYELPTDEQIDQEVAELLAEQEAELANAGGSRAEQQDVAALHEEEEEEGEEEEEQLRGPRVSEAAGRQAAVLMEIMSAPSSTDLEMKLAQFQDDIDDEMIALLQRRIEVAEKVRAAWHC